MSFGDQIKCFSKEHLRPVETNITTPDGRKYVEVRDKKGNVTLISTGCRSYGFIGDVKPDLQVAEVLSGLLMGSQDVAHSFPILHKYRVTHILNVGTGIPNSFPDKILYKNVDILDLPTSNIKQHFQKCFQFIDAARGQGCVLVHCNAGISRSAAIVIAYLMTRTGMPLKDSFEYLKSKRYYIRPNEGFMKQLQELDSQLERQKARAAR